jgi:hypothetical protein
LIRHWAGILDVAQKASEQYTKASQQQQQRTSDDLEKAFAALSDVHKALNWKEKLLQEPTWSDIVKEIEYVFWKGSGERTPIQRLDDMFDRCTNAYEKYKAECVLPGATASDPMCDKWTSLEKISLALNTAEYFVRHIEDPGPTTEKELAERQSQAVKFYTLVHPIIQERAKQITGM